MKKFGMDPRIVGTALTTVAMAVVMVGCGGMKSSSGILGSSSISSNANAISGKLSMSVYEGSSLVYTDAQASGQSNSLTLTAGKTYSLRLANTNDIAGMTYQLIATQTNIVGGVPTPINLAIGNNTFTPPGSGSYSYKIVGTLNSGAVASSNYIAAVTCPNNLTAASLNTGGVSVSMTGANLYSLSASGLTSGASGTAPYQCAWDPTGTNIKDTAFKSCDSAVTNFYSNFMGNRKVNILVKDACGTTVSVSKTLNFAAAVPSMPGNTFITGIVSNAGGSGSSSGTAAGDLRIDGVNYLATNNGGYNIVQPAYSSGKFQIYAAMNYQMPSSVRFGIEIKLKGLTDNLDVAGQTGTVNASSAVIESVTYKTDQAGDTNPSVSLSGATANCVLTNQNAVVHFIAGTPCTVGTGTGNKATVEVYGHYKCVGMTSASGAKIDLEGDFDGMQTLADSCSGGGGGGGGVQPITF